MKKTILLMSVLLLAGSVQQTDAQTRRKTTTRTTTTQQRTAPAEKIVKEVAFYDVKIMDFCVGEKYLYYVEAMPNNAVMKIDRKTGEVSTVMPGIANVYEGRRPVMTRIDEAGQKLICQYGDYPGSVAIKNYSKWEGNKDWERVLKTNGSYALIMRHDGGTEVYNAWNMKPVSIKGLPNGGIENELFPIGIETHHLREIDMKGGVWYPHFYGNKFGVVCVSENNEPKFYDLSTQSYIVSEHITSSEGFGNPINWMTMGGSYLYVSCKRRIYRINTYKPNGWEEYAKIPPTLDSSFERFWVNWKGDILSDDRGSRKCCWYYRAGAFDTPLSLGDGKAIRTGMTKFDHTEIWPSLCKVRDDYDNNFIFSDGSKIIIYNPDGIVGYEKARGKIIKP